MKSRIVYLNKVRSISAPIPNGVDILEEISSEEGMFLTQSANVDIKDRVVGSSVMLGKGCSSTEWKEITKEEADIILELRAKALEEELAKSNEELENTLNDD